MLGIDRARSNRFRVQIERGIQGIKPGWVRLTLPYYASEHDVDFILSAVEFVADHGADFVPLYRLSWRDGAWKHIERPVPDIPPLEFTVEALFESAQSFAAGDHESPMSAQQLRAERQRYLDEARSAAAALHDRWQRDPPIWNAPTGDAEIDSLAWFKYVRTDTLTRE